MNTNKKPTVWDHINKAQAERQAKEKAEWEAGGGLFGCLQRTADALGWFLFIIVGVVFSFATFGLVGVFLFTVVMVLWMLTRIMSKKS